MIFIFSLAIQVERFIFLVQVLIIPKEREDAWFVQVVSILSDGLGTTKIRAQLNGEHCQPGIVSIVVFIDVTELLDFIVLVTVGNLKLFVHYWSIVIRD